MSDEDWQAFDLPEEIEKQIASGSPYREFLRVPSMSCGVYTLAAGAKDLQGPHDEDEVYMVTKGRAKVRVDERVATIGPGTILYVRATAEHSFFEIEEELTLLVFFGTGSKHRPERS
jgi:mannose-6-phosphate isomerase-like protein (cupin superfamily)